ncbi:MAG TPA: 4Fe-4S dicluster domain-containing protein [Chloroflexota bacterium]|nr:4Fe-4S dicluster domain-containing protein [Chloroflexota bacterium]
MLNILRASWRTGRVTESYPVLRSEPEHSLRGMPRIDPTRCRASGSCAEACPAGAITLSGEGTVAKRWQLDLARCVCCGLCAEACPHGAIAMDGATELASRTRRDLIVGVTHGPRIEGGSRGPAATDSAEKADRRAGRSHSRIGGLLKRSLHVRHMAAGSDNSTDWEIWALLNPVYDVQRLGIDFVASPRHADLLLVTGAVTRHLEPALRATYEAMPEPRLVVAAGDEACGGGVLQGSYAVAGGVDRCLPVDVYIPGDPPSPRALIQGLLVALDRLDPTAHRTEWTRDSTGRWGY